MTETDAGTDQRRLDGNAAAGRLREVFSFEITTAVLTCGDCGHAGRLAEAAVYADAPALVLRCAGCGGVLLRVATDQGRVRLDLSGTRLLVVDQP
jgi:ribosomal protein S27E